MNPYDEGTPEWLTYETEGELDEEPMQFPADRAYPGPDLARVNAIARPRQCAECKCWFTEQHFCWGQHA